MENFFTLEYWAINPVEKALVIMAWLAVFYFIFKYIFRYQLLYLKLYRYYKKIYLRKNVEIDIEKSKKLLTRLLRYNFKDKIDIKDIKHVYYTVLKEKLCMVFIQNDGKEISCPIENIQVTVGHGNIRVVKVKHNKEKILKRDKIIRLKDIRDLMNGIELTA